MKRILGVGLLVASMSCFVIGIGVAEWVICKRPQCQGINEHIVPSGMLNAWCRFGTFIFGVSGMLLLVHRSSK